MTFWDILDKFVNTLPPILTILLSVTAVVVFIVGFSRRGLNFIKYGFGQLGLDSSLEKRFDDLKADIKVEIGNLKDDMSNLKDDMSNLKDDISNLKDDISNLKNDVGKLNTRIEGIETNHFGHLKNYLGILNGVLLDKDIIDNQTKARLDNELRGM
jgi:SMC interacting uncharacterized protein involved in chromosome segregation